MQRDKLHRLLVYAQQYVPYYQRIFDQVAFQPDDVLTDPASLTRLPLLTKAIIGENFDDLLTTESQRPASPWSLWWTITLGTISWLTCTAT